MNQNERYICRNFSLVVVANFVIYFLISIDYLVEGLALCSGAVKDRFWMLSQQRSRKQIEGWCIFGVLYVLDEMEWS
jgi:hypothetical protein